mmetsp:Transcript_27613/g.108227  ORF Transcript_27613/g.108227 Transcript_27613/m.108227 type:complete len:145 (-) Transcript_27613:554-988(-)
MRSLPSMHWRFMQDCRSQQDFEDADSAFLVCVSRYPRLAEVVAYNADHEWRVKSIIRKMESGILPPSVKISQVNLEDLSEISSVGAFLESLNLEVDDAKLALLFSMDKNSRDRKKKDMLSQAEDSVLPSILDSYSLTSGKRKAL